MLCMTAPENEPSFDMALADTILILERRNMQ